MSNEEKVSKQEQSTKQKFRMKMQEKRIGRMGKKRQNQMLNEMCAKLGVNRDDLVNQVKKKRK